MRRRVPAESPNTSDAIFQKYQALLSSQGGGVPYTRHPAAVPDRAGPALIVLRPGDKVLVALVDDPGEAEAKDLANSLRASFPGVSFTVAGGIAGICVQT